MSISLHYNPKCPTCVRRATLTARLDWLGRVELRTDASPLGEVPPGEIVVVDKPSGRAYAGIDAIRMVCLQVPLFYPYGLALRHSWIRKLVGAEGSTDRSEAET